ncbi:hypothetical protein Q7285_02505 [Glaesserella parasuis]|uniref:Uncharacterized protein n=1 Tax=Glaesserella parasuis TaxID=738 RepID=A0AA42JI62_GLAPU|nr:hypothetical protein [Glaesserella parasuis]MDP0310537.1 hypothetical protein [Glaesserella parasuis]MDP0329826.1 hypothetical protein [Glaesserella parasuis]MDP0392770.1 hypothetical protein [Glaesserella parasuis]MDP0453783.1 hypothetical protein [Glaesserella parasuis]
MKLCRCPICHSNLHLEALIEDEAGRELLAKISQLTHGVAKPMVAYLGLFKPAQSNLSNSRALKIMGDVLELYECSKLLAHCLSETVQSVRKKRLNGQNMEPLANHNYLKSVYETQKATFVTQPAMRAETPEQRLKEDKNRTAIEYIQRYVNLGQEDYVKNTPEYQIWLDWENKQNNG